MSPRDALYVAELTDVSALASISDAWQDLWRRSSSTPFQSPAWILPWWKHVGQGDLRTLAAYRGERLVGILPLFRSSHDPGRLLLLGTGDTDYMDAILEPGDEMDVLQVLLCHLSAGAEERTILDLHELRPSSPLLRPVLPSGWTCRQEATWPCPQLELKEADDELNGAVPPDFLKKLRYYERRAGREGHLSFQRAGAENLMELFQALLELHEARWEDRGEPGVLADPDVQAFHRAVVSEMLEIGVLRLYALRVEERICAVYYGFLYRRRAYYYLSGFDPDFSTFSPGHLIVYRALREARREGAHTFDFLRGGEPYKYAWGAVNAHNTRRICYVDPSGDRTPA